MNAPETFQEALDIILNKDIWNACLVLLDGIIIASKNNN